MFSNFWEDIVIVGLCAGANLIGRNQGKKDALKEIEERNTQNEILELKKQIAQLQIASLQKEKRE